MNFSDLNPNENNEPKCRHGVNGGNRGGCSECPGGLNSEERSEIAMWIETNQCQQTFHEIVREDGQWKCVHYGEDGVVVECKESEYDVSDLAA